MVAGSRIEVDPRKRHPMDFALWKASKPGEPFWDSPWGPGRPGWHIECSAMSSKYLGQPFDIHGGGSDLVFPHHENEIAQSEGAHGTTFANYWLHNGMVTIAHEKMSKSLGNFMTIAEAGRIVGGEALRLFVVGTHYRGPLDFSEDRLRESKKALDRLYETLGRADDALQGRSVTADPEALEAVLGQFREAMDDDLNTARGLAVLFENLRALNRHLDGEAWQPAATCRTAIRRIGEVLGIGLREPRTVLVEGRHAHLAESDLSPEQIEDLIAQRTAARKARDFKRADEIRNELLAKRIVLKDTPQGTTWEVERGA
jgi:cysteinyl-tRNA synthetase